MFCFFLFLFVKLFGLNIFYLAFSIHIYIYEHITVQASGLEQKKVGLTASNLYKKTKL